MGYDEARMDDEEEEIPCTTLLQRDFHNIHRTMPGLRRSGVDPNAIRQVSLLFINHLKFHIFPFAFQHFYPDGGWGWIVCGVAFLAHVLTTGFQLSYGFLLLYTIKHLGQEVATETGELYVPLILL